MPDLINGLGGPAGFGENEAPENFFSFGPIDLTPIFEQGITWFGRRYESVWINTIGRLTFDGPLLSNFEDEKEGSLGITAYEVFANVQAPPLPASPGGTSQGTNDIWYDIDTENGVFTVTWDDIRSFDETSDALVAYQIRLIDIGDDPGAAPGDMRVELRYEEIGWVDNGEDFGGGIPVVGYVGASAAEGGTFLERLVPPEEDALFALDDGDVISLTFGASGIGGPVREPISGTAGSDRILGTAEADFILPGAGRRDIVLPGLGEDTIAMRDGQKVVIGTPEELDGDILDRPGWEDVLLFRGVAFEAEDVQFFDEPVLSLFVNDRRAGFPEIEIGLPAGLPGGSVVTATTSQGTYVGYVRNLPDLESGLAVGTPARFAGNLATEGYLRGDGAADFALRLDQELDDGLTLGIYEIDRDGTIVDTRLVASPGAQPTGPVILDDIEAGHEIGIFVLRADDPTLLDADSFTFVRQDRAPATFENGPLRLVTGEGDLLAGQIVHGPRRELGPDGQRALIGAGDGPGLTLAFETGDLSGADFADVVLSIERLAVEVI